MSRESTSKRWWQTLPAILGGLATLMGALTGLIIALNQMGVFNGTEKPADRGPPIDVHKTEENSNKKKSVGLGRLTFVTDRMGALRPLVTYLKEHDAQITVIKSQDLGDIAIARPDIVILGDDTKGVWKNMSKSVLNQIFENYKVIGIGEGGTALFRLLGLELAGVMHGRIPQVVVEIPDLLKSPFPITAPDKVIGVYKSSQAYVVGVYDDGSPAVAGFEGVARWEDRENYWPIARQGNYVLWGFQAHTDRMSDSGKRLFANLLINHKAQPSIPLTKARKKVKYVKPGLISDVLNSQFSGHSWAFQVHNVGRVRATLSWNPAERPLAMILNGPGKGGYYARKDGTTNLTIEFDVENEHIAKGTDWRISVKSFENLGNTRIDYSLDLSFP